MKRGIDIIRKLYIEPQRVRELEQRGTVSNIIKVAGKYVDMGLFADAKSKDLWIASANHRGIHLFEKGDR